MGNTWEYLGIIEATWGHGGRLGTLLRIYTWGILEDTWNNWKQPGTCWGGAPGDTGGIHAPPFLPPILLQAQLWQNWSRTGRRAAGVPVGPCTRLPFFPPNCGWGSLLPSPPDPPSSPRRPWAVQCCIPGRILPGPSRASLPSWVSGTGHPEWVLHVHHGTPPILVCCTPPMPSPPVWVLAPITHTLSS